MNRTEALLMSKQRRLQRIVDLAHEELEEIERELAELRGTTSLNATFFWKYVAEALRERTTGATSAELLRIMREEFRLNVSDSAFRVFLSRYKKRQKLTLGVSGKDRWELSAEARDSFRESKNALNEVARD
jgi:hypothetical protein